MGLLMIDSHVRVSEFSAPGILISSCLIPLYNSRCDTLQLALWWCLFENASASVRSGDIFSGFIYLISGSNSTVGFIQGINGCMQVLFLTLLPSFRIAFLKQRCDAFAWWYIDAHQHFLLCGWLAQCQQACIPFSSSVTCACGGLSK